MTDPVLDPAAYWTGVAHRALIAFIRAREAELGLTHPQFWLLSALAEQNNRTLSELRRDLRAPVPAGGDRPADELRAPLPPAGDRPPVDPRAPLPTDDLAADDLAAEAESLLDQRLVTVDRHGRLRITAAGRTARDEQSRHLPEITAHIHAGIPDADYDAALSVLRRLVVNVS
ncbi:MarR family transcriptional regulator [Actinoplanes sp. NPDC023936]|uniref:MarR family transcriptional regulator n=1 Tax=Actinoplanes sp. NPDC023936 TaxID=3154910 RepID=UPI0034059F85